MKLPPYEEIVILPPVQPGEQSTHPIDYLFTREQAWLVQKCAAIVRNADVAGSSLANKKHALVNSLSLLLPTNALDA